MMKLGRRYQNKHQIPSLIPPAAVGGLQGYPCDHSSMLPAEISPGSFSLPLIRQGHARCVHTHFLQGFVSSGRKGQQTICQA